MKRELFVVERVVGSTEDRLEILRVKLFHDKVTAEKFVADNPTEWQPMVETRFSL